MYLSVNSNKVSQLLGQDTPPQKQRERELVLQRQKSFGSVGKESTDFFVYKDPQ